MVVLRDESTHAVIGHGSDNSAGVIEFHDCQLSAITGALRINREGGDVRVVVCDKGKMDAAIQREVDLLIHEKFKEFLGKK